MRPTTSRMRPSRGISPAPMLAGSPNSPISNATSSRYSASSRRPTITNITEVRRELDPLPVEVIPLRYSCTYLRLAIPAPCCYTASAPCDADATRREPGRQEAVGHNRCFRPDLRSFVRICVDTVVRALRLVSRRSRRPATVSASFHRTWFGEQSGRTRHSQKWPAIVAMQETPSTHTAWLDENSEESRVEDEVHAYSRCCVDVVVRLFRHV